jgi:acyl-CoA synthetase (AMP-forming)/AMP-acid ligase II
MKGYLNRDDATAASFDKDGFLLTGDIAYADETGHFFIVDRAKDFIKYNAFQVAPNELEGILQTHEAVADACVVGYYCPERATELPMAYVSLKPGYADKVTPEELVSYAAERTASYKRLRGGVELVSEIPRSASGKILRRIMREKAKERAKTPQAKL